MRRIKGREMGKGELRSERDTRTTVNNVNCVTEKDNKCINLQ